MINHDVQSVINEVIKVSNKQLKDAIREVAKLSTNELDTLYDIVDFLRIAHKYIETEESHDSISRY